MIQRVPIEERQKLTVGDAAHKPAKTVHPCIQTLAHGKQQHGLLRLRLPLHDLVIVIELDVEKRRAAPMKSFLQIGELRLVLHIERHQRVHLRRRRQHTMIDAVGASLMREAIFPFHAPDRLRIELRPKINDCGPLLRLCPAKGRAKLIIAPLEMPLLADDEDGLRQTIDGIIHNIVDIAYDAHTVAVKSALSVTTTFPRKRSKNGPKQECRRPQVGVITERHKRKGEHDNQMDRKIDPCG